MIFACKPLDDCCYALENYKSVLQAAVFVDSRNSQP